MEIIKIQALKIMTQSFFEKERHSKLIKKISETIRMLFLIQRDSIILKIC